MSDLKNLPVEQLMTREVIYVEANETMERVANVFKTEPIHHIPVLDGGKVVGIISKTDYLTIIHGLTLFKNRNSEEYNKALLRSLLAREVMTKRVVCLRPEQSITQAADIFKENLFHALPVTDNSGNLLGIITTFDLLNHAFS